MSRDVVAHSLRAARTRIGWTRETLSHHSGLSWAAIAQIESGRRTDIRLSSLVRLADALGITIDELVNGQPPPAKMIHGALMYAGADDFATSAVTYLREGVARDERPLAVTSTQRIDRVRDGLGADANRVTFADWHDWYRSPTAALNGYRDYLNAQLARGARRVRILGEPVWRGRTPAEIKAWARYESLINIVFAAAPSVLLCPYNTRSVPRAVMAAAQRTHPRVQAGVKDEPSMDYLDAEEFLLQA